MSERPEPNRNYTFDALELEALRPYGTVIRHEVGEHLSAEGDEKADVLILLSGRLDVFMHDKGEEMRVGWLEPGQFTGDVSMITGQASIVRTEMIDAGEVLHLSFESLKRVLVENPGLSDAFVTTFIARRAWARRMGRAGVILVGRGLDRASFALRDLLSKHDIPHVYVEVDADETAEKVLADHSLGPLDAPVMIFGADRRLVKPSIEEAGRALGLDLLPDGATADVVVVGAGPAGLSSSVYAASEGLSVVTIDGVAPGGQAGTSSKIENYLGFPSGVSGRELADAARVQAQKFGARIGAPVAAVALERHGDGYLVRLKDDRALAAKAVVIATGADYKRLPIDGLEGYEGAGIYYGATAMEAQICRGASVAVIGAGNSAGQGASFLAATAKDVHVLYRRKDIRDTMSEYLVRRLEETPNIHFHPETELSGLDGVDGRLRSIEVARPAGRETFQTPFLFMFIGAAPCTSWLDGQLAMDERGFIKTGPDLTPQELVRGGWILDRMPSRYETSWPRIYAVGDVRSGSVKRVASGVGEGSIAVSAIHAALAEMD